MKKEEKISAISLYNSENEDKKNTEYKKVAAWFLGPKGENVDVLTNLIVDSIKEHAEYRKTHYKKEDPEYITEDIKKSLEYSTQIEYLKKVRKELSDRLEGCVPFYTPRYQAHMLWDTVIPGDVGYITAMLHNQNNVATEASPVTCELEQEVGMDLCNLLGFQADKNQEPWGHITADGSIANLESMWAARNLKFYPLAVKDALEQNKNLTLAKDTLKITMPYQEKQVYKLFCKCSEWELLNLNQDDILRITHDILTIYRNHGMEDITEETLVEYFSPYMIQNIGILKFMKNHPDIADVKIFVPSTNHYSWPKSATVLGLGQDAVEGIPVDQYCRMNLDILNEKLDYCQKNKIPVIMVVAVMGSTEEGAVDNVCEILHIRESYRSSECNLLNFNIHCDAAWGGYMKTMIIPPKKKKVLLRDSGYVPYLPLSEYAIKQYQEMEKVDTITIDPHKAGFIPYPAGALCYRNGALRSFITFNASYIHSDSKLNMGIYGLEGSKPGAAPAAVWMAHRAIPLDQSGYGLILSECTFSTKLYYCYWLTLADYVKTFELEMLIPLPKSIQLANSEKVLEGEEEIKEFIKTHIIGKHNEEIAKDMDAMELLRQIGTDVLINCFIVNIKGNQNINIINTLNEKIFDLFSIQTPEKAKANTVEYILMMSGLNTSVYEEPLFHIKEKWKVEFKQAKQVNCLINTIMNPWPTTYGFIDVIMKTFVAGVEKCIEEVMSESLNCVE